MVTGELLLCKVLCSKSLKTCFMDRAMSLQPCSLSTSNSPVQPQALYFSQTSVKKDWFCCMEWKISPESKFNWSRRLGMKLSDVWVSGMLWYLLLRSFHQLFSYQRRCSPLLSTVPASPVTPVLSITTVAHIQRACGGVCWARFESKKIWSTYISWVCIRGSVETEKSFLKAN